jgi:2-polyprenyl-3-methyl-5-hydroxy-6-metoxy-1,4-benzoquinol methylase
MRDSGLTEQSFWEGYWKNNQGLKKGRMNLSMRALLDTFDRYLPTNPQLTILEIGGAGGEYLLYLARRFRYTPYSLDYSRAGNEQTLKTFADAGMTVEVFERDLFAGNVDLPRFDIVFSLGFIEHFDNPSAVVARHLEFVKPNGILLLGVPNYAGIYEPVLKRLAPSMLQTHNLAIMDMERWKPFESELNLGIIFKGYIGGFEPLNMKKMEVRTVSNRILYFWVRVLMVLFSFRGKFLRRFNSRSWSGYMVGIYRKPA